MIELPGFPRTFTSRQIECISCHNHFAVAEEFKENNQPNGVRPSTPDDPLENNGWRITQDQTADTRLRYQEARSNRLIAPPTSSAPSGRRSNDQLLAADYDNFLCCPRCGADNRNWVQLQNRQTTHRVLERFNSTRMPQILLVLALSVSIAAILFAILNPSWLPKQFIPLTIGLIVAGSVIFTLLNFSGSLFPDENGQHILLGVGVAAVFIALFAFTIIVTRAPNTVWEQAVPLGITAVAAGILPALAIASDWREILHNVREHHYLSNQFRSPIWRFLLAGSFFLLFFAALVPLLLYVVFPTAFDVMFELPERSPVMFIQNDVAGIQEKLTQWQIQEDTPDERNQITVELAGIIQQSSQKLLTHDEQLSELRKLIAELEKNEAVPPGLMKEIRAGIDGLKQTEAELEIFVDGQRNPSLLLPPAISWQFYFFWLVFVGMNTMFSTMAGTVASIQFSNRANAQLPPPIFHSVAAMTRIVVWEAKQALEVRGVIMDYIQWTAVERNDLGGITLIGLHRDQPELQMPDVMIGQRVPAQVYTVQSDRWAGIVEAKLLGTTAGPAPRVPGTNLSQSFFADVDRQAYNNLRS